MTSLEIGLILRWIVALWVLGWLVFPVSARLFSFLPDRGLALGRILALVFGSLFCFVGAGIHILPLGIGSGLVAVFALLIGSGWRSPDLKNQVQKDWRPLLVSDAVFLLAFGFFLWVRLRNPNIGDLEKPMDMALLSSAMRATWLPFENPWFAEQQFTNYYYFGPLMGAVTSRILATPPQYAYNLVQPMLCGFFLSATWSLCSSLSKSMKLGVVAMLLVCLGGHFEPLRQITEALRQPTETRTFWPLSWWNTSRVIQTGFDGHPTITINEYPAFSALIGDLHAHFYAFCLAIAFFCLCLGILKAEVPRLRSTHILLGGLLLGVFAIANTWDVPFYLLLWIGTMIYSSQREKWVFCNYRALLAAVILAPLVTLPYFLRFKSQVSGAVVDPWVPDLFSFALLWGGWIMLAVIALGLEPSEEKPSAEAIFRRLMMGVGLLTLLFPYFIYIKGVFGDGDLRYQDTIFKFGLQAWLLLGVGISCELLARINAWKKNAKLRGKLAVGSAGLAYLCVMALAPIIVAWNRANIGNEVELSLNAGSYLPSTDRDGVEWLRVHAQPGEKIIEAVKIDDQGQPSGDYDAAFGRVSAISGVPAIIGWPRHVNAWGAEWGEVVRRVNLVRSIYSDPAALTELKKLGATYLFLGANEPKLAPTPVLKEVWRSPGGETQILRLIG